MKAFIINYNRLTLPRNMADYLADVPGIEPVIIDNNSTYGPLLEYYENCPHKVERMKDNYGHTVVFHPDTHIKDKYQLDNGQRFIISDPDLDLSGIPKDFPHLLNIGLDRYPWACKSGFSLEINDIPEEAKPDVIVFEWGYWTKKLDDYFWAAYIDTTFCLCRGMVHDYPSVRTDRPYTARHVPWYYTPDNIPEDERYYLQTAGSWSTWSNKWRERYG